MLRRTAIGLTGCAHDGAWSSFEEILGWEKVKTPEPRRPLLRPRGRSLRGERLGRP